MSILDDLNPEQREAAQALDGPVMIVAGAGSGKTRVLTYRIAHLIQSGVPPETILALTFTNKAAGEMKSRIGVLLGSAGRQIWAGTFHSVFARVLRMECHHLGYNRNFSIYDTDDSLSLLRGIMNGLGIPFQEMTPQSAQHRISREKNQLVSPRSLKGRATDSIEKKTAEIYEAYERSLKQNNAFDFDDLLVKPLELFEKRPAILEKYQHRFRHLLVDEYQDTNRVQSVLIRELVRKNRNVCVVGDDAQSIYAFRGADIRNMLEFEQLFSPCRVFRLEQNYRSTKTILAAANTLIRNNIDQIPKRLWTDNDEGERVVVTRCVDDRDEGSRVVAIVEEELLRRKLDLKDFAVLYRTNSQSRSIEDAFRRQGIPYTIIGSIAFYKRKEIKDVLAYLHLIANPADERSLLRVMNVPPRGIGEKTLAKLTSLATREGASLFDAIGSANLSTILPEGTCRKVKVLSDMLKKYLALKDQMSLGELARSIVDEIGLLRILKDENTAESLARRENIQELVSAITEFTEHRSEARLEDFLEEVSLVSDVDTADFGRNAVTLMTVHAAKGLEFPVVCMVGLEEGIFPLAGSLGEQQGLEEERRLMYVGMTRARLKLHLLYVSTRYRYGDHSYMVRSRFLDEIDAEFLTQSTYGERHEGRRRAAHSASLIAPQRHSRYEEQSEVRSEVIPSYEDESQEETHPTVGLRVHHASFGEGRIVALDGTGERARAIVDFDSVGKKVLLLKFAHLRSV